MAPMAVVGVIISIATGGAGSLLSLALRLAQAALRPGAPSPPRVTPNAGPPDSRAPSPGGACSFTGATEVLMAGKTTVPIGEVGVGDRVWATDPVTGEEGPRTVTAVWVHQDTVIDLEVEGGATVSTTEDHPFWNRTDQRWQQAAVLDPGDLLLAVDGTEVTVTGLLYDTRHDTTAYNLTINDLHTYYVIVGNTPVLVHNTGCGGGPDDIAQSIADHANGEALRPDGAGTHFVRGVNQNALAHYVDGVINGNVPSVRIRYLRNGRVGYWDPDKQAVVIEDGDGGTVFTPSGGESWFYNVLK